MVCHAPGASDRQGSYRHGAENGDSSPNAVGNHVSGAGTSPCGVQGTAPAGIVARPVAGSHKIQARVGQAPLAQWQSNGLLIRRFWVQIPGGARFRMSARVHRARRQSSGARGKPNGEAQGAPWLSYAIPGYEPANHRLDCHAELVVTSLDPAHGAIDLSAAHERPPLAGVTRSFSRGRRFSSSISTPVSTTPASTT